MDTHVTFAVLLVVALGFSWLNGMHDAANVVATMIASRALTPRGALGIAAAGEFIGPLVFGVAVATTVGKDLVSPDGVTITVVLAALVAASAWDVVTWKFGIPSSSSHALAGGLVGSAVAYAGWNVLRIGGLIKIGVALFASPIVGFIVGWLLLRLILRLAAGASPRINTWFNRAQVLTAGALSVSHGSNDSQKTMGVITLGLVTLGYQSEFHVPLWVVLASATVISAGTAIGGWRIIRTLGGKFYRIRPVHSFASQTSSAAVIAVASIFGGPVSTTHVVSATIVGVGASERASMVRWHHMADIGVAWLITVPVTLVIGWGAYWALVPVFGR